MNFIFTFQLQPENCLSSYDPNGYCVIYSSADKSSFLVAERILQALWTSENIAQKAVILVANKADLARSRTVSSEGMYIYFIDSLPSWEFTQGNDSPANIWWLNT